jgi:hypothetical protein
MRQAAWCSLAALFFFTNVEGAERVLPPPAGRLYHGLFFDETPAGSDDASEHDVTPEDVARYETAVGKKTAWIYFSDNWFESRRFPLATCDWIHRLGKVPYVRLMLRSDTDQERAEKRFTLSKIIAGDFDNDLRAWARDGKSFGSPVLIEWGTEPNGDWFSWNGKWNGDEEEGPSRYITAYRHIVDVMRSEGAENLQWIWHVNWLDQPDAKWNRFENYYPGDEYCDWLALSAYGPLTPRATDGAENFRFKMREAYPRLTKVAPGKPIIIAEFGCDIHNAKVRAAEWAQSALDDLLTGRWPAVIGFCWWNESWENDDVAKHNSDMHILHDAALTNVFRSELEKHADRIQETPLLERR